VGDVDRLLEGEIYIYRGVLYVVKGYQHPEGFVIAYPRYSVLRGSMLSTHQREIYSQSIYWDCIKQCVPVISLSNSYRYVSRQVSRGVEQVKQTLESLLEREIYLTGSALVSEEPRDLDLVVYGADSAVVENLEKLFERGVLKRAPSLIVKEYLEKHSNKMSLQDYMYLKKKTLLHGYLMGFHVNLKLIWLERGFSGCVDRVKEYTLFTGRVKVVKALNPHRLPARYLAITSSGEMCLESFRELYAELEPGEYYAVNSRVEERENGLYLVPDQGVLKPL